MIAPRTNGLSYKEMLFHVGRVLLAVLIVKSGDHLWRTYVYTLLQPFQLSPIWLLLEAMIGLAVAGIASAVVCSKSDAYVAVPAGLWIYFEDLRRSLNYEPVAEIEIRRPPLEHVVISLLGIAIILAGRAFYRMFLLPRAKGLLKFGVRGTVQPPPSAESS